MVTEAAESWIRGRVEPTTLTGTLAEVLAPPASVTVRVMDPALPRGASADTPTDSEEPDAEALTPAGTSDRV